MEKLSNWPLHPLLVHFPIGVWTCATLADIAMYIGFVPSQFIQATYYALWFANLGAFVTVLAGFWDWASNKFTKEAQSVLYKHIIFASTAFVLYLAASLIRSNGVQANIQTLEIVLEVAGLLALLLAGHLGGTLVFQHQIATKKP